MRNEEEVKKKRKSSKKENWHVQLDEN